MAAVVVRDSQVVDVQSLRGVQTRGGYCLEDKVLFVARLKVGALNAETKLRRLRKAQAWYVARAQANQRHLFAIFFVHAHAKWSELHYLRIPLLYSIGISSGL